MQSEGNYLRAYNLLVDVQVFPYQAKRLLRVVITEKRPIKQFLPTQKRKACFTCLTLYPALALVSINITFNSLAFLSPSSVETCLLSAKSVLLPTAKRTQSISLAIHDDGDEEEEEFTKHYNNITSTFCPNIINPF